MLSLKNKRRLDDLSHRVELLKRQLADFDESKHFRDARGRFSSGVGSVGEALVATGSGAALFGAVVGSPHLLLGGIGTAAAGGLLKAIAHVVRKHSIPTEHNQKVLTDSLREGFSTPKMTIDEAVNWINASSKALVHSVGHTPSEAINMINKSLFDLKHEFPKFISEDFGKSEQSDQDKVLARIDLLLQAVAKVNRFQSA